MTIKPTARQLEFMSWEFGLFFHFGIRTFCPGHVDWDGREEEMTPDRFNPPDLDCRQWIRTAKEAGARYTILTAKHHDGFANWPSKHTEYNISKTPWKGGQGDVVADYVAACREYGIKIGIYYSPADANANKRRLTHEEYDQNFIDQISELLSWYGEIDYLWFDGCGSEGHEYDRARIVAAIRSLQPNLLIFNMWDPDTRWIGNEAGFAPLTNFSTVSDLDFSVLTDQKTALGTALFLPGECDVQLRPGSWFTSEDDADRIRTTDALMGIYDCSVGRGANLLLNIGPDASGLLPAPDVARLMEFARARDKRFSQPAFVLENPRLADGVLTLCLPQALPVNCIVLQGNLEEGEPITSFKIQAHPAHANAPVDLYEGTSVGHKRLCSFPTATAKTFILTVNAGAKTPPADCIRSVRLYDHPAY